jgi:hypothetical protein
MASRVQAPIGWSVKPYIQDGKTIVVAPHRVWGPETNDLVLHSSANAGSATLATPKGTRPFFGTVVTM